MQEVTPLTKNSTITKGSLVIERSMGAVLINGGAGSSSTNKKKTHPIARGTLGIE